VAVAARRTGERYFTGLALTTRKAGTTRTVTPRKVSVSKPRSLITSTAPLARSMSIPARGARKREPLLLLLLFLPAVPYQGAPPTRRRTQRVDAEVGAGAAQARRRTWCRASAAAAAEAAADAMAPRRAARVPKLPERRGLPGRVGAGCVCTRGPPEGEETLRRVASPRARGAYLLSGCERGLANSEESWEDG
jgi:hypothetical protein